MTPGTTCDEATGPAAKARPRGTALAAGKDRDCWAVGLDDQRATATRPSVDWRLAFFVLARAVVAVHVGTRK